MDNKTRIKNIQKARKLIQQAKEIFDHAVINTARQHYDVKLAFDILLNQGSPWEEGLDDIESYFKKVDEGIINE